MNGLFSASFTIAPFALVSPVKSLFASACAARSTTPGTPTRTSMPTRPLRARCAAARPKIAIVTAASGRVVTRSAPASPSSHPRPATGRPRRIPSSRRSHATSAIAHVARKNATSIPDQSDHVSAPMPRKTGGKRYELARPQSSRSSSMKRRRDASSVPKTLIAATIAAHFIRSRPTKPTSQPSASTKGYVRLVLPDEYPLPIVHSNG